MFFQARLLSTAYGLCISDFDKLSPELPELFGKVVSLFEWPSGLASGNFSAFVACVPGRTALVVLGPGQWSLLIDVSVFLKELSCYRAGTVLVIFVSPVPGMDVVYSRYLINNMQEAKGMFVERYSHSD